MLTRTEDRLSPVFSQYHRARGPCTLVGRRGGCWLGANIAIVCFLQVVMLLCCMALSSTRIEPEMEQSKYSLQREWKVCEIIYMIRLHAPRWNCHYFLFIYLFFTFGHMNMTRLQFMLCLRQVLYKGCAQTIDNFSRVFACLPPSILYINFRH